jgi:hypothetical protein
MGKVFDFVFQSAKGKGGYNVSTGTIYHPPKGQGKIKVKAKMKQRKEGK